MKEVGDARIFFSKNMYKWKIKSTEKNIGQISDTDEYDAACAIGK